MIEKLASKHSYYIETISIEVSICIENEINLCKIENSKNEQNSNLFQNKIVPWNDYYIHTLRSLIAFCGERLKQHSKLFQADVYIYTTYNIIWIPQKSNWRKCENPKGFRFQQLVSNAAITSDIFSFGFPLLISHLKHFHLRMHIMQVWFEFNSCT